MQPAPAQIGSLEIFWPLIEPVLDALQPRRICEVGVAAGVLTNRLLAWAEQRECSYVGIDPAPAANVIERFRATGGRTDCQLMLQTSHAAFADLAACDVYFLDGDHNYHTVQGELSWIAHAARRGEQSCRGPVVFMHDVGWPWGRRDMYYLPSTVPPEARQPWSETLGVALDGEDLIEGGLREPGRYAIALRPGGPRNGVLTAVEDFLRGADGADWECNILPAAYGLAVLHRPADTSLPAACRQRLDDVRRMAVTGGAFLQACEDNLLRLYLAGEYYRHASVTESSTHFTTLLAYDDLLAHYHSLDAEYHRLRGVYERLREEVDDRASSPPPADQFEKT